MFDGDREPCVAPHELGPNGIWEKDHGKPCPRVDLAPANANAQALLWLAMHEHTRPLVPELARRSLASKTDEQAAEVILRVGAALLSRKALEVLYPKPKGTEAKSAAHTGKPMRRVSGGGLRDAAAAAADRERQIRGVRKER